MANKAGKTGEPVPFIGAYDHMNVNDPLTVQIDLDALADQIVDLNHGTSRMLAALVRARQRHPVHGNPKMPYDRLRQELVDLLERGVY